MNDHDSDYFLVWTCTGGNWVSGQDYPDLPPPRDEYSFMLRLQKGGFAGKADFVVSGSDLQEFIGELKAFYEDFFQEIGPEIELRVAPPQGYGDLFILNLTRRNRQGDVKIECRVSRTVFDGHTDELQVQGILSIMSVDEMTRFLENALTFPDSPQTLSLGQKV